MVGFVVLIEGITHNEIIVAGSISDEVITVTLASTQPLTEISTSYLPGSKGRSTRKADARGGVVG
jgi:hypothetical protein